MPWKRGNGPVEVELANVQSLLETIDPELHGDGTDNNPGVVAIVRNDKAAREQRHSDLRFLVVLAGLVPVLLKLGEMAHIIPK